MAITAQDPRKIHLAGPGTKVDGEAAEPITPGHLVEKTSAGEYGKQDTQDAAAAPLFAREFSEDNRAYDDDYADGEELMMVHAGRGAKIYAWLPSGQDIDDGALLGANGDGTLKAVGSGVALAYADEAVDNSAGPDEKRIKVVIL